MRFFEYKFRLWGFALAVLLAVGCSPAPVYQRPESPAPPTLGRMDDGRVTAPSLPELSWSGFFSDPGLKELISLALENNRDLRIAALNTAEARSSYQVQRSERFPQANLQGLADWSGDFGNSSTQRDFQLSLGSSFELDLFSRMKNLSDAAFENYLATAEAEKAAKIALISEVARSYLLYCLALEQSALAQSTLQNRKASAAFIEKQFQSGLLSLLELEQARSLVQSAEALAAQREREKITAFSNLGLLTGTNDLSSIIKTRPLMLQSLASMPENLPSEVLLGRPDVLEAEHQLRAAHADIGAARAAFFPSISLTGELGGMSSSLNSLFSKGFWSLIPQINLPIFNAGRIAANLDLAEIRKEKTVAVYEKAIQTAFKEVSDALLSRKHYADQLEAQKSYFASEKRVLELASHRHASGSISYLEVLDADRSLFQAQQDLLDIRNEQLINEINLFSALGGGKI